MFELRKLPFDPKANAVVSEETCNYHHGKHHQTYVNNLNNLIKGTEFEGTSLFDILTKSSGGVFNNAAQVYNHDFYWDCIAKKSQMSDELKARLEKDIPNFKEEFLKAATTLFGSGWAWLVYNPKENKLQIVQTSNAQTPVTDGLVPLLVADVWEHAYYLKFQNRRPDYIKEFWNVVNWDEAQRRFDQAA